MKRTKVFVTLVTTICMAVTMFPAYTFAEEATAENVIEIGTAAELQTAAINAYGNGVPEGTTYKLTADIDFSGFPYVWGTIAIPFSFVLPINLLISALCNINFFTRRGSLLKIFPFSYGLICIP